MKALGFVVFALVITTFAVLWSLRGGPSWYGVAVMSVLSIKLVLSWRSPVWTTRTRIQAERVANLVVGVAIPMYNEDPDIIAASLRSLLAQTRLPQSVAIVDDCSGDTRALAEAERWTPAFAEKGIPVTVIRFEENRGKREGLIACLEAQPEADVMLCVDSDTVLDERALEQALIPFHDAGVSVVTGLVLALNYRTNLLTRLIDIRYANAFLFERAAYSALGSVLCACGSLAIYRTSLMQKYKHDFLTQTFLGAPAVFGDDRRLTNYGLLEGRVLFQQTAIAYTAVPERWGHYLRQQVRWNKSFFRESLWALGNLPMNRWGFWLTLSEVLTWAVFSVAVLWALVVAPLMTGVLLLGPYLIYIVLVAYARSVRYLDLTGVRQTRRDKLIGFAISPLYGVVHILLLMWLRIYALCTLRSGAGARARASR
ncbi:glycosyltransferase [Leifsonia poae]|uniref:glycosyltransferase n=1 Tax=Leifsonia poae TaxID=110933 RepID=UPI003D69BCC7